MKYIKPETLTELKEITLQKGIKNAVSGTFRNSYNAMENIIDMTFF